jgi:ketosteroid isomerase-like protein
MDNGQYTGARRGAATRPTAHHTAAHRRLRRPPVRRPPATVQPLRPALLGALALALATPGCGDRPEGGAAKDHRVVTGGAGQRSAQEDSLAHRVSEAFFRSREALRALDVETFLEGYEEGPGLIVLDPAGEHIGRQAFEASMRTWFAAARRSRETYPVVTARERVRVLDGRTAVLLVDWSSPGGPGPHRSLLVYRKGNDGWRIAAEHSAPMPPESPPRPRAAAPSGRGAAGAVPPL